MKTSRFSSILLFALFYTALLSTMVVVPLVLAARYDAGMATVDGDAEVWEGSLDAPAKVNPRHQLCLPQCDESVAGPAAMQVPIYKSGPDAAMIKPGKARAKTIKV